MYINVRVIAGAKREVVEPLSDSRLKISVKEPAERNLANRRVTELVARHLQVPVTKVRLLNGHTSPSKIFSVEE